jgi:hypothetical protein
VQPGSAAPLNPTGNIASGNFGRITAVDEPRIMQFGVRYVF